MNPFSTTAQTMAIGFIAITLTAVLISSTAGAGLAIFVAMVTAGTGFLAFHRISIEVVGHFATLALFGTITFNGFRLAGIPLADGLLVAALVSLLILNVLDRGFLVTPGAPLAVFAFTISVAALLSELFFPSGGSSLVEAGQLFLATAGVGALAYRFALRTGDLDQIVLWFVVGCAVSASLAILEQTGSSSLSQQLTGNSSFLFTGRSSGLTTHPNQLGLASAMALPLAFYLRNRFQGPRRVAGTASALALGGGVLASGSRAAILAVLLTIGIAGLRTVRSNDRSYDAGRLAFGFFGGSLAALAVVTWLPEVLQLILRNVGRVIGDNSTEIANADRSDRLDAALADIVGSPLFGTGFVDSAAHSWPVQIIQTTGLLGFIGFATLLAVAVRRVSFPASSRYAISTWLAIALISWFGAALFHNGFTQRYFYVIVALALALPACRQHALELAPSPAPAGSVKRSTRAKVLT